MSIKSISLTDKIISQKEVKDFLQKANLNQRGSLIGLFDKKKIIGAGSLYTNSFHPYRDYINIHIEKDYRNKGLGSRLLKALKEKNENAAISYMKEHIQNGFKYIKENHN